MRLEWVWLLALGFVGGIALGGVWGVPNASLTLTQWLIAGDVIAVAMVIAGLATGKWWWGGPRWWFWLLMGTIALGGVGYGQWRSPVPSPNDLSQQWQQLPKPVAIQGEILESPQLNRSDRLKFILQARAYGQTDKTPSQAITGKLYVTLPLLQGTGLYEGQQVTITGNLYAPPPAANPGGFDFRQYLARQGVFTGMRGATVEQAAPEPPWALWKIRRRIVRSQQLGLGSPRGQLLSAMLLGRGAVDLPYDLRDRFTQVGMAHVLAASGFQVSLLLGVVLGLLRSRSPKVQFFAGAALLLFYGGLTGLEPSVVRAILMGLGGLVGLTVGRQVNALATLLWAAVLMLLWQPLWLWDVGFQLSFLATLGLLISQKPLADKLNRLPPAIAEAIAIPLAATLWTLPLQLYHFKILTTYGLLVNVIATPLIALLSLGSAISGVLALVWSPLGSGVAWVLGYPLTGLIGLVNHIGDLPGSTWAVGQIQGSQLLLIYGVLVMLWRWPAAQKQARWVLLATAVLVILPIAYPQMTLRQWTAIAGPRDPVVLFQDRGQTTLVNLDRPDTVRYNLLPLLASQGINHLDRAVIVNANPASLEAWRDLAQAIPVKQWVTRVTLPRDPLGLGIEPETVTPTTGAILVRQTLGDRVWWLLYGDADNLKNFAPPQEAPPEALIWQGWALPPSWWQGKTPAYLVISDRRFVPREQLPEVFRNQPQQWFWTNRDGAIQWRQLPRRSPQWEKMGNFTPD